jgi:hypothetical protein
MIVFFRVLIAVAILWTLFFFLVTGATAASPHNVPISTLIYFASMALIGVLVIIGCAIGITRIKKQSS